MKEITIPTSANAICLFHFPDMSDAQHSMRVDADSGGIVHLWAPQVAERYVIDCDENGTTVTRNVDLADSATFDPVAPRVVVNNKRILPALTDPMALSQSALIKAGYPPRPDPVLAAPYYQQWLAIVSVPTTLVTPHYVSRPDRVLDSYTAKNYKNWDGLVLQVTGKRYQWSLVTFTVPTGAFPPGYTTDESAFWGGIGYHSPIIQDGVLITTTGSTHQYHAVIDYAPDPSQPDSDFTVRPGDSMTFWAWECDASHAVAVGGGYGCFWYKNNTTGYAIDASDTSITAIHPGLTFSGEGAPFVVERICPDGTCASPIPLTNFNVMSMEATAFDSNSVAHNFHTDHYDWITMVNLSGQTLADSLHYGGDDIELLGWVQAE